MRIGLGIGLDFAKKRGSLVAPVATAATSVTGTSFVANWNTYDGATTYYLDVSISSSFSTFVLQNQAVSAPTTSYTVTGLTACTTYYYRVRAEGVVPTISVAPTLSPSGSQITGTVITCGTGTWNSQGSIFNYKWKRNGVAITGATSNTYTIQAIDAGTTITCDVQNQNGFGKSAYVGTSNSVSATSFIGILDTYPNAAAAYSLRKLRAAYTGSAVRIRRSSDNTETNIGFTSGGDFDSSAAQSFCGAGNGFVTTWYDQSGNGINATQTTAANQTRIVNNGAIITMGTNGKATTNTNLNGTFATYGFTIPSSISDFTWSSVFKRDGSAYGGSDSVFIASLNTPFNQMYSNNSNYFYFRNSSNLFTGQAVNTNPIIISITQGTNIKDYYNGTNINNVASIATTSGVSEILGISTIAYGNNGAFSEFVIWQNNLDSSISNIISNQNTYYGIF